MPPVDALEMRWVLPWTLVFVLLIFGVTFFFFSVSGEVPWGKCPEVTRAPENEFWEPEYKNSSEKPMCPASAGERWGTGVGGVLMIALSFGVIYAHTTLTG
jgi:hypothetical protein